jgi:Zn-dependent oligopeptidase
MPEKKTIERARKAKREGKAPSTQAGEFVREKMEHVREGKHGARSTKQAIAIGLSKARRAGVKLPPPKKGTTSEKTRRSAELASRHGQSGHPHKTNPRRSHAITEALQREGHGAASSAALSRQAKQQARKRTAEERSEIARKAARTRLAHQSPEERSAIVRKAARARLAKS